MYVALCGQRIAGFSSIDKTEVYAVYVHPKFTGRGIGRALLSSTEKYALAHGIKKLFLNATRTSLTFYRENGYRKLRALKHRLPNGTKIPCFRMSKVLR
jgi:GNAT superfamily N-acetyltransferase